MAGGECYYYDEVIKRRRRDKRLMTILWIFCPLLMIVARHVVLNRFERPTNGE